MNARRPRSILMYHSISTGAGATCIAPEVFRTQLEILAASGCDVVPLSQLWDDDAREQGEAPPHAREPNSNRRPAVAITFDDGFQDFADVAWESLAKHEFPATVFLPAGKLGGCDDWESPAGSAASRPLMTWATARDLARQGVSFGGHGVTHADLTTLSSTRMASEVAESRRLIEEHLGVPATSFAAPYGRSNSSVRRAIATHYACAVGTRLARLSPRCDRYNLPRVEMWYFRHPARWQEFLRGHDVYFAFRRTLRAARSLTRMG